MKKLCLLGLLLLPYIIKSQIITTVAGGGSGGDGGPATAASIFDPCYLVLDPIGNLYFTEYASHRVRKVDTSGIITTIAGNGTAGFSGDGGPATAAMVNQPSGIAIDNLGNIFFADNLNNRIRKIEAVTGVISTVIGNSTAGFAGDGSTASAATLSHPGGICFDKSGNLYIADDLNERIRKVNTSGIITTVAGNGITGNVGDGGQATAAECMPYAGICIDNSGNLYIAEYTGFIVRKVNPTGVITTIAGDTSAYMYNGDGIPATSANIVPFYIAINGSGTLYISDYNNNRIRTIDASGIIHTIAGNGTGGYSGDGEPSTAAELNWPSGIAFDRCDNLYIAQVNDPRIRKVTFNTPPCTYLSVNSLIKETSINIYPNPAYDILNIDNLKTQATYRLLSVVGAAVQQGNLKEGSNSIDIRAIANGMYMLEVSSSGDEKIIRKIIKQ